MNSTSTHSPNHKQVTHPMVWLPLLVSVLIWVGPYVLFPKHLGAAILISSFTVLYAFVVGDDDARTVISTVGIVLILASVFRLLDANEIKDLKVWYQLKILFVIFFGVLAAYLIEKLVIAKWPNTSIGIMGVLLFTTLVWKSLSEPSCDGVLYAWSDYFEDVAFCIAGTLAAEIVR